MDILKEGRQVKAKHTTRAHGANITRIQRTAVQLVSPLAYSDQTSRPHAQNRPRELAHPRPPSGTHRYAPRRNLHTLHPPSVASSSSSIVTKSRTPPPFHPLAPSSLILRRMYRKPGPPLRKTVQQPPERQNSALPSILRIALPCVAMCVRVLWYQAARCPRGLVLLKVACLARGAANAGIKRRRRKIEEKRRRGPGERPSQENKTVSAWFRCPR
ncbi:hypothetical protein EV126DRAFT_72556 [Verticillium dahliae]|nr:hypothetical protein EV126DRAFT_72556 [Verticillium dahliae]